jgi:hypothetical protein
VRVYLLERFQWTLRCNSLINVVFAAPDLFPGKDPKTILEGTFKIVPVVSQSEGLGGMPGLNEQFHDVEHINDIPQFVKPQLECGQLCY